MNNGIIDVTIETEQVVTSNKNYNTILVLGSFESSKTLPPFVGRSRIYSSLESLKKEGWIENDSVYRAVKAIFSQPRRPEFVRVGRHDPSIKEGETTSSEKVSQALEKIRKESDSWYGLVSTLKDEKSLQELSELAESQKFILATSLSDPQMFEETLKEGFLKNLIQKKYNQTLILYHESAQTQEDVYIEGAFLAQGFSQTPGSLNWATLPISNIKPSSFGREKQLLLEAKNINYFAQLYNISRVRQARMIGGEWIDIVTGAYYLENRMNEILSDFLTKQYSKVGYQDSDIEAIKVVMKSVLIDFQKINFISSYLISVPKAKDISLQEKQKRELQNVQFEAHLVGAINFIKVIGTLTHREFSIELA